jgi:3-oxoacyl-[acyl-carrier protein] reductase
MDDLKGKVAIVTGAAKGIGAAIARQLAKGGAAVVVNYVSSKDDADQVVGDILRGGGKAVAIQADASKATDVKRLFAKAKATFGPPSILVNNAGVYSFGPIEKVTEAEFHRQFDTNVLSTILTTQEALNAFGPGGGSIINLSSVSSTNPVQNSVVYSASKAAVDAITKALANELAARKIRVNAIAPGMTETEGLAVIGIEGETAKNLGASVPMGRLGRPDDIAHVAVFLASDQSAWVTGERITASGGQH